MFWIFRRVRQGSVEHNYAVLQDDGRYVIEDIDGNSHLYPPVTEEKRG